MRINKNGANESYLMIILYILRQLSNHLFSVINLSSAGVNPISFAFS